MPVFNFQYTVIDGADDVDSTGFIFDVSNPTVSLNPATINREPLWRFRLDDVQQGATVTNATLTLKAASAWSDDFSPLIRLENVDSSAPFDTVTPENHKTDRIWLAGTTWDTSPWSSGATITTVNFSAQLQTIVNRAGFGPGSYVCICLSATNSDKDDGRASFYALEDGTEPAAILNITVDQPGASNSANNSRMFFMLR